jgi:hypothetical protein
LWIVLRSFDKGDLNGEETSKEGRKKGPQEKEVIFFNSFWAFQGAASR